MKKIITMAYLSAMVLGLTMAFSSCSNDANDNNNTPNTAVNPKTVFTGGLPKSAVGMTIRTNEKGQVATLQRSYEKATFEYIEPTTYATNSFNVIMTVENSEEETVSTCFLFLNKNGFVTHSDVTTIYKPDDKRSHQTWDFTYNNDGQLLTMSTSSDNDDDVGEKTNIIYNNGDIFAISRERKNGREKETCRAYYTSPSVSSPIPNKGCIMVYGRIIMDISVDVMEYAYYAGLLGKANKNLPVRVVDYDNDTYDITWTLNSAGYPISLNDGHRTYSFEW